MKYLALVAACLLVFGLAPSATADELPATPTFTWSEVTSFNPAVHTYEVVVSGPGEYPYQLRTNSWQVLSIPGPGSYAVPFPVVGNSVTTDAAEIRRCVDDQCSAPLAASPTVTLVRGLWVTWTADDDSRWAAPGDDLVLPYEVRPVVPGLELRWHVLREGERDLDAAVATGEVATPGARGEATVAIPSDLPHGGRYDVVLRATRDGDPYGHLASVSSGFQVRIDAVAPRPRLVLDRHRFFPLADLDDHGVPSRLEFDMYADENTTGTLTITGPDGVVVETSRYDLWGGEGDAIWSGRHRRVVHPEGRYLLRLVVEDEAGHTGTTTASAYLSHDRLHTMVARRSVPAARTVVATSVGECASVSVPSSHGWKGSIGYAAQSRCTRPAESSAVTLHRLYLPESWHGWYGVELEYFGVAADAKPGSMLASGWVNRRGKVPNGFNYARGPVARWNTLPQESPPLHVDDRGRRFVLCALVVGADDRYDVKSFRIRVKYYRFH